MFSFIMWLEYSKDSSVIPEFIFPEVLKFSLQFAKRIYESVFFLSLFVEIIQV